MKPIDRAELEAEHCYFSADRVSGRPDVTEFKQRARLHQAGWRQAQGLKIGSHWSGKPRAERPNGSKIDPEEAVATAANLLSDRIRSAAKDRLAASQPHETLDVTRLWGDLLSSMPMCFNLFGELHQDAERLASAVAAIWPTQLGVAKEVLFEWSPGRRDDRFLNDRTAFDAAIVTVTSAGTKGIIGIETKYHEHIVSEKAPDELKRLPRYAAVTEQSGIFVNGWRSAILGTELQQIWRDHLLVLSMLQSAEPWMSGRYVLVHPAENASFGEAGARYRDLLTDDRTFEVRTIEELLDAHVLHPAAVEAQFRARYLWSEGA